MKCKNCGFENDQDATFCQGCGQKLTMIKFCKYCGGEISAETRCCTACGKETIASERKEKIKNLPTPSLKGPDMMRFGAAGLSALLFIVLLVHWIRVPVLNYLNATTKYSLFQVSRFIGQMREYVGGRELELVNTFATIIIILCIITLILLTVNFFLMIVRKRNILSHLSFILSAIIPVIMFIVVASVNHTIKSGMGGMFGSVISLTAMPYICFIMAIIGEGLIVYLDGHFGKLTNLPQKRTSINPHQRLLKKIKATNIARDILASIQIILGIILCSSQISYCLYGCVGILNLLISAITIKKPHRATSNSNQIKLLILFFINIAITIIVFAKILFWILFSIVMAFIIVNIIHFKNEQKLSEIEYTSINVSDYNNQDQYRKIKRRGIAGLVLSCLLFITLLVWLLKPPFANYERFILILYIGINIWNSYYFYTIAYDKQNAEFFLSDSFARLFSRRFLITVICNAFAMISIPIFRIYGLFSPVEALIIGISQLIIWNISNITFNFGQTIIAIIERALKET